VNNGVALLFRDGDSENLEIGHVDNDRLIGTDCQVLTKPKSAKVTMRNFGESMSYLDVQTC
jgi:hypothetical protein